jgi:hypothetical protein
MIPKGIVYSEATVVIALDTPFHFSVLSSSFHEAWSWKNSSTMGAATLRYSTSKAFETFPFPLITNQYVNELGLALEISRKTLMNNMRIGLTEIYNVFHDSKLNPLSTVHPEIIKLRSLHCEIDKSVAEIYGWVDIELKHGFYEIDYLPENDRIRFSIHPDARREILKGLSILNNERNSSEQIILTKSQNKKKAKFVVPLLPTPILFTDQKDN